MRGRPERIDCIDKLSFMMGMALASFFGEGEHGIGMGRTWCRHDCDVMIRY